jgi:hypothetical protein
MDSPSSSLEQRNVAKEYRNSVHTYGYSINFPRRKECAGSIDEFHEKQMDSQFQSKNGMLRNYTRISCQANGQPLSLTRRTECDGTIQEFNGKETGLSVEQFKWIQLHGIRRIYLRIWRSQSLYLFIRRVIKKVYSNYRGVSLCQVHTKCFQHLALNVNSICRGNYWGSLVWISTQQVKHWSYILHSSNTPERMGIQWKSASAIYRLQESLWFI